METSEFDIDSMIVVHINNVFKNLINMTVPKNTNSYSLMMSFPSTDIDLIEEISLNQISDFISSVGGNLGLFTGFSFLSALLTLAEWFRKTKVKCCPLPRS